MDHKVRQARTDEAAELTALIFASKQSNGYDDAFMQACEDELRVQASDIANGSIWVIGDAPLMGCATLVISPETGTGEVSSFFIHPDHKRQGVGRALWDHLLKQAKAQGIKTLELDADPAAVPFYEAMGWRVTGNSPSGSIPGRLLPKMAYVL